MTNKKKILLVDDTQTVIMWQKMILGTVRYELAEAKNGREALARLEDFPADLVLLDVMMPEMDGIETCQRIKDNPITQHIPVVMVTTKGETEKVEAAFMAGCDDYVTKPIDKMVLLSRVNTYLA